jgi:hypothetical protein
MTEKSLSNLPDETVISKIYLLRNQKVMLDRDLAELYGVETRILNQAVKRNADRFPGDFMFELTQDEYESLRSQIVISNKGRGGSRYMPMAFTEAGVAMLSSVLNSDTAIKVNIQIIRVFTKMREMIATNKEILLQIEKIELKLTHHDRDLAIVFHHLKKLLNPPQPPRPKVGFRRKDELE